MIHFKFADQDKRYIFLKGDNTPDEIIHITKKLKTKEKVESHHILEYIKDYMNLTDPICFLPTYTGQPFTQDFMFDYTQPSGEKVYYCAMGLWQDVYKILKQHNVPFDGLTENQHRFKLKIKHTFEEFKEIVDSWGLKFPPRPYQYEAAYKILQWRQSSSELATRAGKTLIAYIIFRYEMEYMGMKRILAIVPSIDLVKQMYNDFREYKEFFNTECIWSGGKLVESANITVGTFQSLIKFIDKTSKKYNPRFFDGYDCVFVDEMHKAKANQIHTIISQPFMQEVKIVFGMTGTLPPEHSIDHFCVHALLGAKIQTVKPIELMEAGYIAPIEIEQHRLQYTNKEKQRDLFIKCAEYALSEFITVPNAKNPKKRDKVLLSNPEFLVRYKKELPENIIEAKEELYYEDDTEVNNDNIQEGELFGFEMLDTGKRKKPKKDIPLTVKSKYISLLKTIIQNSPNTNGLVIERMMSHFMFERIDYLCNEILPKCDKNTLILAHHTEYINYFADIIKERFPNKHIDVITGSVNDKRRDQIKNMLKENNDCILIGSYGVMSTGITLSNLCYGVLFESFKSNIINMQSLGRGLGLSDLKDKYRVYDIIDVFDKEIGNKILGQGEEKRKIYKRNEYTYKIINKEV